MPRLMVENVDAAGQRSALVLVYPFLLKMLMF